MVQHPNENVVSQGIQEIWTLVSKLVNFLLGLSRNPSIALAPSPFRVLTPEQNMLQDTPAQQKHRLITQNDAVAWLVPWLVLSTVNI